MNRIIIAILFCSISISIFAQNISVAQFKLDEKDHTASNDATMKFDQNGEVCAVIKIITKETGFSFDVGSLGVTETDTLHSGQIWLYVPYGIKKITLRHQDYGTCEFNIPMIIESEKTYRMSLNINGVTTELDHQRLTFTCTPINASVLIDDKTIILKDGVYEETLGIGVHSYSVEATDYIPQSGTFEMKANAPANIVVTLAQITSEKNNKNSNIDWDTQKEIEYLVPGTEVKFVMIPVKTTDFNMGATNEQNESFDDEVPIHACHIDGFFMGQTEVTQELWETVMGSNPSRFKGKELPVEQVTWNDCQMFIGRLNAIVGHTFRLPTEAEWECAARSALAISSNAYSGDGGIDELAWYAKNSQHTTHTIATKKPNALGIYDMNGNVSEWCQDWYQNYSNTEQVNPKGASSGTHKVSRGGNWLDASWNCRTTSREMNAPNEKSSTIGLRLAM